MKNKKIDMLNGPLVGKIVIFAMPLALSSILQQLFNSADLAVVGRFDSDKAMAAVGSNSSLVNLIVSLFLGLSVGANVVVARLIGQGRKDKANEAVHTVVLLAVISGFIILGVGEILAPILLGMMNVPDDVLKLATLYLRIFFFAMPFIEIYDFGSAVLRSKGDSTRPLYALITAGVINVILNLVFVIVFKMGVAGVATATVISNFFSACMILYFLTHEEEMLRLDVRKLRIRWEYLLGIIKIGLPAGLQSMVFSLSNVVIQAAINSFGSDGIAGSTAEQNFEFMAYFVINAFAQTATTFTSQNFAAQDKERCKKIYRLCTFIGLASCLGLSMIFLIGRHLFIQIFSTDENVIHYAMIRMWSVCLLELLTGVYEISGGCLRGMGHSMTPAVITVLGTCVFRLVWVNTIYAAHRSYLMLMIVYPVSWVITGTAVTVAYFIIRRREFAQIGKRRADII